MLATVHIFSNRVLCQDSVSSFNHLSLCSRRPMEPYTSHLPSDELDEYGLRRTRSTGDIRITPNRFNSRRSTGQSGSLTRSANTSPLNSPAARVTLENGTPYSPHLPAGTVDDHSDPTNRPRPSSPHSSWNIPNLVFTDEPFNATTPTNQAQAQMLPRRNNFVTKVMIFFGYAGPNAKGRREFISLAWSLSFGAAQFITIVTLSAYSAHHRSPTQPALSEWDACERPLGAWNALWLGRVSLGSLLSYWGWRREREARFIQQQRDQSTDPENLTGRSATASGTPRINGTATPSRRDPLREQGQRSQQGQPSQLPYSHLYARLSLITSVLSLVWFLTAHILEYTSVNTCRHSAPHLWWLTFGILCILYLMILEIFLLGLLVFILGPVIFLVYNIVLLCMGRHPIQNPHGFKPEIGKLPKSVVDQIPLVLYIPPPPEEAGNDHPPKSSITVPSPSYSYPPKKPIDSSLTKESQNQRRRFAWFRKSRKSLQSDGDGKTEVGSPSRWEDNWEEGEYPFVRLEDNRATCAICLLDFDKPKPKKGLGEGGDGGEDRADDSATKSFQEEASTPHAHTQVEEVNNAGPGANDDIDNGMRLEDAEAGEGVQPLRLLSCGHVFHQSCVDPWLTGQSGRCPTCQRPVEVPNSKQNKKNSRNQNRRG
ncbi:hypothetical protein ABKN59_003933 [Abortiporus biennis]